MNTPAIVKPSTKKKFNQANQQGEYISEDFSHFSLEVFKSDYWAAKKAITGTAQGRGTTYFIQSDTESQWVLRHYYRGGLIGKLIHDSYLFTGIKNTRAAKEFTLLDQLHRTGLPVPKPVAYNVIKKGLVYSADLLTHRIENAQDLVAMLSKAAISKALYQKIGKVIRSFHENNVYHHDLNAHNILIDAQENVWIIDFDQGEIRDGSTQWKTENLARLERSFLKEKNKLSSFFWENENWQQLLSGYQ